jgi:hypothetical protein
VHDYAFLLVCERRFAEALPLLEALTDAPIPPEDRVIGWSTYARTAAELGGAEEFGAGETHVLKMVPHYPLHASAAFVNLAFGARALGDWQLAEVYARKGTAAAESAGHRLVLQVGQELLAEIAECRPGPPPVPPPSGSTSGTVGDLAAALADQLASWRGATWTRREQQSGVGSLGPV